jgi:quinol monooxygenase YgiN
MAILLDQVMPQTVDVAMLDEVSAEMGVDSDPPAGMIVHVHFTENGRTRVVDVWESAEQLEQFRQSRLMPAILKVAERRGVSMDEQPQTSVTEVASIVRGR